MKKNYAFLPLHIPENSFLRIYPCLKLLSRKFTFQKINVFARKLICPNAEKLIIHWHSQDFRWEGGGQTTNYMHCRHQNFLKEELLWDKDIVE